MAAARPTGRKTRVRQAGANNNDDTRQAAAKDLRRAARSAQPENAPAHRARRFSRLGGAGGRRPVLVLLRPGRGLQGARRARASRPVPRARDRRHGVRHLARLQPGDRAVPERGRRLQGGDQAHQPARGSGIGLGPHPRLRAHHRHLGGERRRRALQHASRDGRAVQARHRTPHRRDPAHSQPARDEGIDHRAAADLCRLHPHAHLPDRLRRPVPHRPRTGASPGDAGRDFRPRQGARLDIRRGAFPAGLFAGRRHLHGDRGGVEQRAVARRAARPDRQAHDVLHGGLARLHRGRDHSSLPAMGVDAGRGSDAQCRGVRIDHRDLQLGRGNERRGRALDGAHLRGGTAAGASNTGFLGGPAVLANMAADSWVPHQFRYLSTRLVTENGILVMGIAALGILLWTRGSVDLLVVLYSINVFLTFSMSLLGLCIYWVGARKTDSRWVKRLALSVLGLAVTLGILVVTIVEKFTEGGWVTVAITTLVIAFGLIIQHHYEETKRRIRKFDAVFEEQRFGSVVKPPKLEPEAPTAAFIVGSHRGGGLHALLWVQRMFPNHFRNFVFINARTVDSQSYGGEESLRLLRQEATVSLNYFVNFCNSYGLAAKSYLAFGTDPIEDITRLCGQVNRDFPNTIFFTSKLIFEKDNWFTRLLHNQAPLVLQNRLHMQGMQMIILPMRLDK